MIIQSQCWQINCDQCGDTFYDDRDSIPHYTSEAAAREAEVHQCCAPERIDRCEYGLELQPDGSLLCRSCSHRALCERDGHTWDDWEHYDAAAGYLPAHKQRFCPVCDDLEFDPPARELLAQQRAAGAK